MPGRTLSHRASLFAPTLWIVAASLLLTGPSAFAQEPNAQDMAVQDATVVDPPAHVSFVEGVASIERDGKTDTSPANMPLLAGDRIRTESGRVEVLFADGSLLHIDNFTTVDFQSDEVLRVLDGRVRLTIAGRSRDVSYRLDAASAWAQIAQPGEYRLAILRQNGSVDVELAVLRGGAELVNEDGRTPLRAGERAFARAGAAPSYAYVFNSAAWDAFDRWSESRRDDRLGVSAQYLPDEVRPYSRVLDSYGSWRHEPTYGYVWYPRVATTWRPYYYGRWTSLRPYGWVWVGNDAWGWPTHHYGRWGFSAGSWFWIPGRTWGPAWVSWGYAPGYVSWCPLGWNNRPVIQIVNVNVYRGYDPWRAWTVVPRSHFGVSYVHRSYVGGHSLDLRVRNAFEFRDRGPDVRSYAVPRAGSAIRVAGTAVPRGGGRVSSSPLYTNLDPRDGRVRSGGSRVQMGSPTSPSDSPRAVPRGDGAPGYRAEENGGRSRAVPQYRGDDSGVRNRAVPRSEVEPESRGERGTDSGTERRGVRSLPPVRIEPLGEPAPVMRDRDNGAGDGGRAYRRGVPGSQPREQPVEREAPSYRRTPPVERTPEESRPAYGAPGPRAVPRANPEGRSYGGEPRVPAERRAPPDGGDHGQRAVPRPQGGPPPPTRAPERTAPRGGGSGGDAPAHRRRG
jgi:uncharacterized protein DUF6600/FecR-like protein